MTLTRKTLLAVAGALLTIGSASASEDNWCWKMSPSSDAMNALITINDVASDAPLMRQEFKDGSSRSVKLNKVRANTFLEAESDFGDGYRVLSNGSLQIYDSDGPVDNALPTSRSKCLGAK